MKRRAFIGGNWKMNGSSQTLLELTREISAQLNDAIEADIAVFPSYVYLETVRSAMGNLLKLGAQNVSEHEKGAYTGEISAGMLVDIGCQYVLVGHSERRHLYHETPALVAEKFERALANNLKPVLCVGETKEEREKGRTESVILAQLQPVIDKTGIDSLRRAVLAYEPVWAIGTGLSATPLQAQSVHQFIRRQIAELDQSIAETLRIVYGGSVKPDNAKDLFAQADIDGGLVGGASLKAKDFAAICSSALV